MSCNRKSPLLVAIIGVGLVGSEVVQQLLHVRDTLAHGAQSKFEIVALSTSRSILFSPDGLALTNATWRAVFDEHTLGAAALASPQLTLLELVNALVQLANSSSSSSSSPGSGSGSGYGAGGRQQREVVFIDNTAADTVAELYPRLLRAGVHIVTPNKKAFSTSQALADDIAAASAASGARVLHEATVGAGLPIISTLNDLVATGDEVTKIEGVFSGTMSYIFNNFSPSPSSASASISPPAFSSVVAEARLNGYTEPHPAEDLAGSDVARKLTILARLLPGRISQALPNGYKSVDTQSLVPPALADVKTGDEFVARLSYSDADFAELREQAHKEKKVLRYVGFIDVANGIIKASLEKYDNTHAFATSLGGSDNIIMFHTKRYGERPLIIQGAGAGAAVTAMGVLSDLFKLAQ